MKNFCSFFEHSIFFSNCFLYIYVNTIENEAKNYKKAAIIYKNNKKHNIQMIIFFTFGY